MQGSFEQLRTWGVGVGFGIAGLMNVNCVCRIEDSGRFPKAEQGHSDMDCR